MKNLAFNLKTLHLVHTSLINHKRNSSPKQISETNRGFLRLNMEIAVIMNFKNNKVDENFFH